MTKVACIGAGSWGTTVAALIAQNGHDVVLWCRRAELAEQINESRDRTSRYLPGIRLPENLRATADIEEAMSGAEVCVMGVPSHGWREVLGRSRSSSNDVEAVVSLTKGLEVDTNLRMSELLSEVCPDFRRRGSRCSPGRTSRRRSPGGCPPRRRSRAPTRRAASWLQEIVHQPYFRVYTNTDVIGSRARRRDQEHRRDRGRHRRHDGLRRQRDGGAHDARTRRAHAARHPARRPAAHVRRPRRHGRHDRHVHLEVLAQPPCR